MTKSKWKITTIILLTAVFVSLIVLLVIQSVNNSRLLDYLLEYRIDKVTYRSYDGYGLMLTTYKPNNDYGNDSGIMPMADVSVSGGDNVFSAYGGDGCIDISTNYPYEVVDTMDGYCEITVKSGSTVIESVYYQPYTNCCTVSVGAYTSGEVYYEGFIYNSRVGDMQQVSGIICSFTVYNEPEPPSVSDLPKPPTKTGYTFTGWYTDEACTNPYTEDKVIGDISLYAGFRAHTYTVKFDANGTDGEMTNVSMTYDKAVDLPTSTFTKEHFRFKGWATSAIGAVTYTDGQNVKNLTAADGATVVLFAVFERFEWVVTFNNDGETTTGTVAVNTAATLPDAPSKEGYKFIGWEMSNGNLYTNQAITADTTLTAKYEIIRCKITFYVDGKVYGQYECDYGTNVSELLQATGVNPILYKVAETSFNGAEKIITDGVADLELTAVGEVVPEEYFPWAAAAVAFAVVFVVSVSGVVIFKAVKH